LLERCFFLHLDGGHFYSMHSREFGSFALIFYIMLLNNLGNQRFVKSSVFTEAAGFVQRGICYIDFELELGGSGFFLSFFLIF
jgi:hypothetical protein